MESRLNAFSRYMVYAKHFKQKKSQILFKVGLQNDEPNKKKSGIHTLIKTQSWLTA